MPTELTNKQVVCRKPHRCTWCGEWIEKKKPAQYRSGVHEGDFHSDYFHPECYSAMCNSDLGYENEFEPMAQDRGKKWEESASNL